MKRRLFKGLTLFTLVLILTISVLIINSSACFLLDKLLLEPLFAANKGGAFGQPFNGGQPQPPQQPFFAAQSNTTVTGQNGQNAAAGGDVKGDRKLTGNGGSPNGYWDVGTQPTAKQGALGAQTPQANQVAPVNQGPAPATVPNLAPPNQNFNPQQIQATLMSILGQLQKMLSMGKM